MHSWGSFLDSRDVVDRPPSREAHDAAVPEGGDINAAALAGALADRLASIVPALLWVSVHAASVHVLSDRGHGVVADIPMLIGSGGSVVDRIMWACEQTLDLASEVIAEETTERWPARAGEPFAGVEVFEGEIRLWYGRRDAPFLALSPIALSDVLRSAPGDDSALSR